MSDAGIQYVSTSENGEPTAVIVPIELWREIESERETRRSREERSSPQFILKMMSELPRISPEAFDDLEAAIEAGRLPV
jgi:hypothetical protein